MLHLGLKIYTNGVDNYNNNLRSRFRSNCLFEIAMRNSVLALLTSVILLANSTVFAQSTPTGKQFWHFESGQVRPLAMSPDGQRLFAVNTPDNRLEIFDVTAEGLELVDSVVVGLEPVAVAARTNGEVWVVNHLSDSVSVVDVSSTPARLERTLLVGDEPRDIVFAGPRNNSSDPFPRAFITTAHRGQAHDLSGGEKYGDFFTSSVGRADVWVFEANNLGAELGGTPEIILSLFGDTPRALVASADGQKVYVGIFHSGNKTTVIPEQGNFNLPNADFNDAPAIPTIVQYDGNNWLDASGNVDNSPRLQLPDYDVFEIDADAVVPVEVDRFSGVGTILFNMAINPLNGKLYVSNTDANNLQPNEPDITGNIHRSQITVIDGLGMVSPRHINKHIDYSVVPSSVATKNASLATPTGMVIAGDGLLYVAAFGSSKIGIFNTAELDADSFTPSANDHIALSGGGPSGLVLDENNNRLYVLTRFDNGISVVDRNTAAEVSHITLHNPEPVSIIEGRRFLYDAVESSSNGEASCGSCHVFGQMDDLAWDLSDNTATSVILNPNPFNPVLDQIMQFITPAFHPMKGPMVTQSLRGMDKQGPMHWRGDRSGALSGSTFDDEDAGFKQFNSAFVGLLGRTSELNVQQIQQFTDFSLQLSYPPNPIRNLDNSLTADEQAGSDIYHNEITDQATSCNGCHLLDEQAGLFGTDGQSSFEAAPQLMKVAHLRNMYQKVGMFGAIPQAGSVAGQTLNFPAAGPADQPQVRGFGYTHNGTVDTLESFTGASLFSYPGNRTQAINRVSQFMLAYPSDLAPIVGQQLTLSASSGADVQQRIALLKARSQTSFATADSPLQNECDLVVNSVVAGQSRSWFYQGVDNYVSDSNFESVYTEAQMQALLSSGTKLTYTCAPPGSGHRIALDRDMDGLLNYSELSVYGSNPASLDSDSDGLSDIDEVTVYGTAPGLADTDGDGFLDGEELANGTNPIDAAPQLSIISPVSQQVFHSGSTISLSATAIDDEDGDITGSIGWSSNIDGDLGAVTAIALSDGEHTLTATVFDSAGAVSQLTVSVIVDGIAGDINDDSLVDLADLLLLQRHITGVEIISDAGAIHRGDLYPAGDGLLSISDLLQLQQLLVQP